MHFQVNKEFKLHLGKFIPWGIFILSIWLIAVRSLGASWDQIPGNMGDGRFNNFILEHFSRWISGKETNFWDGHFFYPFQQTIAFSDNLLGSAIFYAILRWTGFDRETSFQGWYLFSFFCNYLAAVYVLSKIKFHPVAITLGAFFFTFGLPLLSQEIHLQLFYRFGIPLAVFYLWKFFQEPKIRFLIISSFWVAWQFYLTIYMGFFLTLMFFVMAILLPITAPSLSFWERLVSWPQKIKAAWVNSLQKDRFLGFISLVLLGLSLFVLLQPYYSVTREYGFHRTWERVVETLPQPASYLVSNGSLLWSQSLGANFYLPERWEHSLFPGLTVSILLFVGIVFCFRSPNGYLARLSFWTFAALTLLTLWVDGKSLYWFIFNLPGINSIRAVTRIQLALMWPLAVFIAWTMDELFKRFGQRQIWKLVSGFVFIGFIITESTLFNHITYSKQEAQERLLSLETKIPSGLPSQPILAIRQNELEDEYMTELDAMLLAQEHGWSSMNGYSGNIPFRYSSITKCQEIPARIKKYMKFENVTAPNTFYLDAMQRIVPVGFTDCDPSWWQILH